MSFSPSHRRFRLKRLVDRGARRRSIAAAAVFASTLTGVSAAEEAISPAEDRFWKEREASYRAEPRGPFTALLAEYLAPGESVTFWANDSTFGREEIPGASKMSVTFAVDGSFLTEPAALPESLALGSYLLSVDQQAPDVGRIIAYDPRLLSERFQGFATFLHAPAFRIKGERIEEAPAETLLVSTSRGLEKKLVRAARFRFRLSDSECALSGYREPGETGALFVPFRDASSGAETYGVGRYLRVEWKDGETTAIFDFNHATNPWCAYSPFYNCVLPPQENHLEVQVLAGEKVPPGAAH